MEKENKPQGERQPEGAQQGTHGKVKNPFENNQPVEQDIQQAQEELENEQQFKEAMTERD